MSVIRIRPSRLAMPEWETRFGVVRARLARRAWWAVRYVDGSIVHEWDRDWSHLPYQGRQSVRLYCPDGKLAQLGDTDDATGKLFQFKVGVLASGLGQGTLAQVIGMLSGLDGECLCYAWDGALHGPWSDNVYHMDYHHVGALNAEVLGLADGEGR